jgi:hypothetical protein
MSSFRTRRELFERRDPETRASVAAVALVSGFAFPRIKSGVGAPE